MVRLGQRELVEREAAEGAADVLLAVPPHELGDLGAEPCADHRVALGVVGQEVDRGELDGLQEGVGLRAAGAATSASLEPAVASVAMRLHERIGKPDLLGLDLAAAGPASAGILPRRRRASKPGGRAGSRAGCSPGAGWPSPGRSSG